MEIVSKISASFIREIGIGQGRNSKVCLAYDPQIDDYIAIKEIDERLLRTNPDEYFREARILYRNRSPRIVQIQYAARDNGKIRIAMPYYRNGSLEDILNNNPLTIREVVDFGQQFLSGVHYVHTNRFIHFDIKPSNILIQNDHSVVLSDFGQANSIDNLGTAQVPALYRSHIPPELLGYGAYNRTTNLVDVYQSGLTLYRMCNGNELFRSQQSNDLNVAVDKIIIGEFPNRDLFLPHVPLYLRRIIRKAISIEPWNRYQTIIDLQNDLGKVDKLLDWQYDALKDGAIWKMVNGNRQYVIGFKRTLQDKWQVYGHTISLSDHSKRKITRYCDKPYTTRRLAEQRIYKIFRELEAQ